jgi:predicted regulator of amino acid metabolism with ACT domain
MRSDLPLPMSIYSLLFNVFLMWEEILREFADSPSQSRVVRFLLENGFGVNADARIVCNSVEIPATHVAKATGTDRRVVDATARRILQSPRIAGIFLNLRVTPDLSLVAQELGVSVITVHVRDACEKGIVGAAVRVLTEHDLTIRQIFVTDPMLSEEPKLVIIVNEKLPASVYEELRALPQVSKLII